MEEKSGGNNKSSATLNEHKIMYLINQTVTKKGSKSKVTVLTGVKKKKK